MRSLRLRLFTLLLALAALAALAVGGGTYVSVRAEADELFDYHLRQMALSLRDQGRIPDAERAAFSNPELDYVVQIWSVDGVALYSSQPPATAVPLPPHTVIGFSNVQVGGATWRVFGAAMPQHIVQVGQPLAVRRRLATAAAWRSVLPIVAAAPLVILAMWWLVGFTLAPLQRVVAAARTRDERSLDPLPATGLPDEIQPLVTAFNLLLARLATAFDAQRAFVADAAHELRTPLTALRLQLGLLRDAPDGAPRDAALIRLRAGVDRAAHLVDQLLTLARAGASEGAMCLKRPVR
jgi:two-component system OmpR family sensor kinase/two-component system sensor histidine kinase QseC